MANKPYRFFKVRKIVIFYQSVYKIMKEFIFDQFSSTHIWRIYN